MKKFPTYSLDEEMVHTMDPKRTGEIGRMRDSEIGLEATWISKFATCFKTPMGSTSLHTLNNAAPCVIASRKWRAMLTHQQKLDALDLLVQDDGGMEILKKRKKKEQTGLKESYVRNL